MSQLNPETPIWEWRLGGEGGGGRGQEQAEFVSHAQTNQKDCEQMSEWIVFFTFFNFI